MKYENAKDILPEALLKEIQKYTSGKVIYIPSLIEKKAWGESSGYREQLKKRNQMICNKYQFGHTISELADEFFLSLDSIKKIVYNKRNKTLPYYPNIESACLYMNEGLLEQWGRSFLMFTCKIDETEQEIYDQSLFFGVVKFPLRLIDKIETSQLDLLEKIDRPLFIHYENRKFTVPYQKEMLNYLKGKIPIVFLL